MVAREYAKNLQTNQGQATIRPWRHPSEDSFQSLDAIKQVGNSHPLAIRVDGASLHQSTVNGVKIEVITVGKNVTSGYPAGHKGFQTTTKFLNASN